MKWLFNMGVILWSFFSLGFSELKPLETLQIVGESSFKQWKKLHSATGKCKIAMPDQPEHL